MSLPSNGLDWFALAAAECEFSLGNSGGTTSFGDGGSVAHIIAYSTSIIFIAVLFPFGVSKREP